MNERSWDSLLFKWCRKVRGRFYSTTTACPVCSNPITASVIKGKERFKTDRTLTVSAFCNCYGSFHTVFSHSAIEEKQKGWGLT